MAEDLKLIQLLVDYCIKNDIWVEVDTENTSYIFRDKYGKIISAFDLVEKVYLRIAD